ncbi:MAG: hypothetical protein NDP11_06100, partial [Crenarchaeota archaeon]|nr:hypothetical protein [Thermoproteota archaeon]
SVFYRFKNGRAAGENYISKPHIMWIEVMHLRPSVELNPTGVKNATPNFPEHLLFILLLDKTCYTLSISMMKSLS